MKNKDIVIFTAPECDYCLKTKEYLKKNHVSFEEIDIIRNPFGARELIRITGKTTVPVILAGKEHITGFEELNLNKLLGLN